MLLLILLIVGVILVVGSAHLSRHTYADVGDVVCLILGVLALVAAVVFACCWIGVASTETGYIASQHQLYESLVYQAENCIFENDNDLGKADLVKQITEWNTSLAHNRDMCKNIWVGFLYYQCYDQFEFIPLSLIK